MSVVRILRKTVTVEKGGVRTTTETVVQDQGAGSSEIDQALADARSMTNELERIARAAFAPFRDFFGNRGGRAP
jgi:hypothetical protein